jgi:hypothetical protein
MEALRKLGAVPTMTVTLTLILADLSLTTARGQTALRPSQEASELEAAQAITLARGTPTIIVFTSANQLDSVRLWQEFGGGEWAHTQRGRVQVVHITQEQDPQLVRALGISQFPMVVVYGRGPAGITRLGSIADCPSASTLVARLREMGVGSERMARRDPAVRTAAFYDDIRASQQFQPPAPQVCAPAPPVQQAPPQALQLSLSPAAPVQTMTAGVIQVPSQNLVLQQAPPQVFLSPTQAPVVYVPQSLNLSPAQPNPTLSLSPAPAQGQPTANLFLSVPTQTLASGPPTALNVTAAPATATLNTGPPASLAAVTNQTLSLPSSGSRTRVRVRGPGLLGSFLARVGQHLTQFGRARIETIQETTLEAPMPQSAPGTTTIQTTSTSPIPQQPTLSLSPQQQPTLSLSPQQPPVCNPSTGPQPPVCNPPTGPQPSPQYPQKR